VLVERFQTAIAEAKLPEARDAAARAYIAIARALLVDID
jgi:hypothetical protein